MEHINRRRQQQQQQQQANRRHHHQQQQQANRHHHQHQQQQQVTDYRDLARAVPRDLTPSELAAWREWGREVMGVGVVITADGTMVREAEVATGPGEGRRLLEVIREWGGVLERREEREGEDEEEGDDEMWVWVGGGSVDGVWGTVLGDGEEGEERGGGVDGEWEMGFEEGEGGCPEEKEDEEEEEKEEEGFGYDEWAAARVVAGMGVRYMDFLLWRGRDAMMQEVEDVRRARADAGTGGIPIPNRRHRNGERETRGYNKKR